MATTWTKLASSLLPYTTIEAVASSDVDAINAVVKRFESYLTHLPQECFTTGNPHLCFDEEMKRGLQKIA